MSSKFRLVSVFLVATLIVVAGCSIIAFRANAQAQGLMRVMLRGRAQDSACSDVGTIMVDDVPYGLPTTAMLLVRSHSVSFPARPGCDFVQWEPEGGVSVRDTKAAVTIMDVASDGTLKVVYRGGACCLVGGVVTETNTFTILTPYLVAIGLVATTAAVVVKKHRK